MQDFEILCPYILYRNLYIWQLNLFINFHLKKCSAFLRKHGNLFHIYFFQNQIGIFIIDAKDCE